MEPEGYKPRAKPKPTLVRRLSNMSRTYLAAVIPGLMGGQWSEEAGEVLSKEDLALSVRQKLLIRRTWKIIAVDLKENGIELFRRFFSEHPAYRELFPALKDLTASEVESSLFLRAHGTTVLHSIMSIVDNIDDRRRLEAILRRTSRIHYGFGIRYEHFETMLVILLKFIADKVGSEWDESSEEAWIILMDAMKTVVLDKMCEKEREVNAQGKT